MQLQKMPPTLTHNLFGGISLGNGERFGDRDAAAVGNDHILDGAVTGIGGARLDLAHNIHAGQNLAEDNVTSVQPAGLLGCNEELRAIGVLASIGHAQPTGTIVLQLEVLILEAFTVNGASAGTVTLGEVTTLDHEVLNDAVELAAFVAAIKISRNKLEQIPAITGKLVQQPVLCPWERVNNNLICRIYYLLS